MAHTRLHAEHIIYAREWLAPFLTLIFNGALAEVDHEHNGPYNRKFLSTKILDLLNFVRKMLSSFINLPSPYILQPSYTLMCETNLTLWCITKHIALFSFMLRIWTWKYIITILCNAKGDFNYQEKFYDILAKM